MLNRYCSSLSHFSKLMKHTNKQCMIEKNNQSQRKALLLKYLFSRRKSMEENLKQQSKPKQLIQQSNSKLISNSNNNNIIDNTITYSPQGLSKLSTTKILNMQFFPLTMLITPTILYCDTFYDPNFLLGTLLAEKYSTVMLLMNVDFKKSNYFSYKQKDEKLSVILMLFVASLHTLTGYYSLATPLGMALTTILMPFKFSSQKQRFTQIQKQRISNIMNLRAIYFFVFTLLTTIKAFHYEAEYEIETKLKKIDQQNINQNLNGKNKIKNIK